MTIYVCSMYLLNCLMFTMHHCPDETLHKGMASFSSYRRPKQIFEMVPASMIIAVQSWTGLQTMESRQKLIVKCFKWLSFILCSLAFFWKTFDSFTTYMSADIGTKIILKQNYETNFPAFAICRHPNKIYDTQVLYDHFNFFADMLPSSTRSQRLHFYPQFAVIKNI